MDTLYVMFHVPSNMFADQVDVADDGTIRTCGFAYHKLSDALNVIAALDQIGGNPADWIAIAKPDHVTTDWVL